MRERLESIQILRGIAASLVVLWHLEMVRRSFPPDALPRAPQFLQFGYAGVELFFILSGYIILHVTAGAHFELRAFLVRRFVRIYPIYIAFTLVLIGARWLVPGLREAGAPGLGEIAASLAIFPQREAPLLGPGWTLEHEVLFYALAAVLLALGLRRWLAAMLLGAGALGALLHGVGPLLGYPDPWDWHLLSPFQIGFGTGALLYEQRERLRALGHRVPLLLGVLGVPLCALAIAPYRAGETWKSSGAPLLIEALGYTAAFACAVCGLLNLERAGGLRRAPRLRAALVRIGDASYVLYLSNYLALAAALVVLPRLQLPGALLLPAMVGAFALCLLGSLALHTALERPFLRWATARLARPAAPEAVPPLSRRAAAGAPGTPAAAPPRSSASAR